RYAANVVMKATTASTTAKVTVLATSIDRRCGVAVSVARIVPVEYSALITITPSAPTMSWARNTEKRLNVSARKSGPGPFGSLTTAQAIRHGRPMVSSTVDSSVHIVERTERSLVHSEPTTRVNWVATPTWGLGAAATGTVVVVMSGSF